LGGANVVTLVAQNVDETVAAGWVVVYDENGCGHGRRSVWRLPVADN
jgi:hypothetical protein